MNKCDTCAGRYLKYTNKDTEYPQCFCHKCGQLLKVARQECTYDVNTGKADMIRVILLCPRIIKIPRTLYAYRHGHTAGILTKHTNETQWRIEQMDID